MHSYDVLGSYAVFRQFCRFHTDYNGLWLFISATTFDHPKNPVSGHGTETALR
jgi:hypothetical protein